MGYLGEIDGRRVEISQHALERMVEMGVSAHTLRNALTNPTSKSKSRKYDGCMNYRLGDLTFGVTDRDGHLVVITCVYATRSSWRAAYEGGSLGSGREVRAHIALPES